MLFSLPPYLQKNTGHDSNNKSFPSLEHLSVEQENLLNHRQLLMDDLLTVTKSDNVNPSTSTNKENIAPSAPSITTTVDGDDDDDEQHPDAMMYTFAWSVATQKGYRYTDNISRDRKLDLHVEMEDMHFPSYTESPNFFHAISGQPFQVFMLADGHGGHACALYAIQTLPRAIVEIVNRKVWNLNLDSDRNELRHELQTLFLDVDAAYCRQKLEEFREWINTSSNPVSSLLQVSLRESFSFNVRCNLTVLFSLILAARADVLRTTVARWSLTFFTMAF
jgi:hypothetical protein